MKFALKDSVETQCIWQDFLIHQKVILYKRSWRIFISKAYVMLQQINSKKKIDHPIRSSKK